MRGSVWGTEGPERAKMTEREARTARMREREMKTAGTTERETRTTAAWERPPAKAQTASGCGWGPAALGWGRRRPHTAPGWLKQALRTEYPRATARPAPGLPQPGAEPSPLSGSSEDYPRRLPKTSRRTSPTAISPSPPHSNGGTLQPPPSAGAVGVGEAAATGAAVGVGGTGVGVAVAVAVAVGPGGGAVGVGEGGIAVAMAVGVAVGRVGAGRVAVGGTGVAVGAAGVSCGGGGGGSVGGGTGVRVGTV